jgi:formylglycine-generating enzyme required for sulfatase activity/serine/threonine protein kinase
MDKSFGDEQTIGPASKSGGHAYALRPGEVLGQYRIIRKLGAGGMGEVYEAENTVNRKRVALKVLSRSAMGGTSVDRFRIESRVMMDLRHPHIVEVLHAGEEKGFHYLTMDLVLAQNGEPYTLEDVVREDPAQSGTGRRGTGGRGARGEGGKRDEGRGARGGLSEARVRDLALQICSALEHAHAKGLVHRDLKPANVLIAEDGTLRVADFGLAKVVGEDYLHSMIERSVGLSMQQVSMGDQPTLGGRPDSGSGGTSTHALLGTYDYMSPEQKAGGEITARTDVYALGVILYRMLTGRKPEGAYKPPSRFGVSKGWDRIVEQCLEYDSADRFASVADLKSALQRVGRGLRPSRWLGWAAGLAVLAVAGMFLIPSSPDSGRHGGRPSREGGVSVEAGAVPAVLMEEAASPAPPDAAVAAPAEVTFRFSPGGVNVTVHGDAGLVGQTRVGEDGMYRLALPPGRYEVFAQKDGYALQPDTFTMGDKPLERVIELTPLRGGLTVTTVAGATIQARRVGEDREVNLGVAGEDGALNYDRLVEGHYDLLISHPDYFGRTNRVEVRKDRPAAVDGRLQGKPGRLFVVASPRAEVWVDGVKKGQTGEELTDLAPGLRRIEARLAGFRTEHREVDIPPNRSAPRWNVGNLVRESGTIRVVAEVTPPAAREHFDAVAKGVSVQPRGARGTARPTSVPTLPWVKEELACEPHEVALQVAGYEVGRGVPSAPEVRDGQTTTVTFAVAPKPSRITITSNAKDAEVFDASGKNLGRVGSELTLPSFVSHTLTVRASGYAGGATSFVLNQPDTTFTAREVRLEEITEPRAGDTQRVDLGNGVYLDLVWIPPGRFTMGSPENEPGRDSDESPTHPVTISKGFWMGKTEVTQKQYQQLMGANPSHFKNAGADAPVESVTWHDATNFTGKLQARLRGELQGKKAGLPTEAEWEYACRADTVTPFHTGRCLDTSQANYDGNYPLEGCSKGTYRQTTIKVGSFPANAWGLHDMHGNVWEWCQDGKRTYRQAAETDPGINDTSESSSRVLRGGSWFYYARFCRSAFRYAFAPGFRYDFLGFRVVVR